MAKTAHSVIRGDKAIKKKIAEFLAKFDIRYSHINVQELLMSGHRGYLALSEKDLYKEIDNRYAILQNEEKFEALPKMENISGGWNRKETIAKTREEMLTQAKLIFDEIFEKAFLV